MRWGPNLLGAPLICRVIPRFFGVLHISRVVLFLPRRCCDAANLSAPTPIPIPHHLILSTICNSIIWEVFAYNMYSCNGLFFAQQAVIFSDVGTFQPPPFFLLFVFVLSCFFSSLITLSFFAVYSYPCGDPSIRECWFLIFCGLGERGKGARGKEN